MARPASKPIYASRLKSQLNLLISSKNMKNIANACDVSESAVKQWKHGKMCPSIEKLPIIAEQLDVPIDYLFGIGCDSRDIDVQAIYKNLGLSPTAQKVLAESVSEGKSTVSEPSKHYLGYGALKCINLLIENATREGDGGEILATLYGLLTENYVTGWLGEWGSVFGDDFLQGAEQAIWTHLLNQRIDNMRNCLKESGKLNNTKKEGDKVNNKKSKGRGKAKNEQEVNP